MPITGFALVWCVGLGPARVSTKAKAPARRSVAQRGAAVPRRAPAGSSRLQRAPDANVALTLTAAGRREAARPRLSRTALGFAFMSGQPFLARHARGRVPVRQGGCGIGCKSGAGAAARTPPTRRGPPILSAVLSATFAERSRVLLDEAAREVGPATLLAGR